MNAKSQSFYALTMHLPSDRLGAYGKSVYLAGDGSAWESDPAHGIRFRHKICAWFYQKFRAPRDLRNKLAIAHVWTHPIGWKGEENV